MKTFLLIMALACRALSAEEAGGRGDFSDADALYAPEELTPTAGAASAQESGMRQSFYSTATLKAFEFGKPGRLLSGAELFIDGAFVGKSPLSLKGFLVNKDKVSISARLPGYEEALRPGVRLPAEGEARVALLPENAASWYTTPSWIAGLAAIGGSVAAFAQRSEETNNLGVALVSGGLGLIVVTQVISHFFHQPAAREEAQALNAKPEALP